MSLTNRELMRGNLVCYEGKPRIVKAVSELIMLEGDKNWIGASLMNGEPLSEAWLQKFGFESDGEGGFFRQLKMHNWGMLIKAPSLSQPDWIAFQGFVNTWQELRSMQQVHQLQNLFVSLLGEHLPIPKLPK